MKAIWIQDGPSGKGASEVTVGMLIALLESQGTDTVLIKAGDPVYVVTIEKTTLAQIAARQQGPLRPIDLN